jgi:hypothetical protein
MYVVLSLIFLLPLATYFAVSKMLTFAQSGPSQNRDSIDNIKRRMELREEMHKRMRDKLLLGIGPDQDMFKDLEQMFEDTMTDSFSGFDQLGGARSNFHSEWQESKTGRTLVITPQSPEQKLNIDVFATSNGSRVSSKQGVYAGSRLSYAELPAGVYIFRVTSADGKLSYQFKMIKL